VEFLKGICEIFIGYAEVKMCGPVKAKFCCGSETEISNIPVIFSEFY